ncbi:MAG: helix-turn-helix domain-containing protein [Trueperaceae bacterium]
MKKTVKKYKDPRLNALVGKPEEIIYAPKRKAKEVLVKFSKKEQDALEARLAAQTLARLLQKARSDSGLSVRKVADQMDKHPSRVAAIEKGSTDMAFRTFVEYAHSVGYDVEVTLVPTGKGKQSLTATLPTENTVAI